MNNIKNNSGLTLIEMLIGIVILGMLGVGLLSLQRILGQNQTLVYKNYINVDEASSTVNQFVKEMRIATNGENGAYVFEELDDSEIVFYSDYDFDTSVEKIKYELNGNTLTKTVTEPLGYPATYPTANEKSKVLTENVRNTTEPAFTYYNSDWPLDTENNPLPAVNRLQDTTTIKIYLRINTKEDETNKDFVIESYVQPRMLKENL